MKKQPNPEHIDDDNPEWTAEAVKNAKPFSALTPALQAKLRGRPKLAVTKEPVKLRLDADLLAALRATGDGWQTRINDMLRASMHLAGRF
ncbi:MAG: BrnA antitoxin family protein [Rhodoferax sp.]